MFMIEQKSRIICGRPFINTYCLYHFLEYTFFKLVILQSTALTSGVIGDVFNPSPLDWVTPEMTQIVEGDWAVGALQG